MRHDPATLIAEGSRVLDLYRRAGWRIVTAESCTGGLVAACLTETAGSSDVVERGFVTYSNAAKTDLLGVPAALIRREGAVSEPVAKAMAEGALVRSQAEVAVSVTGIAGPGGATPGKPVGLVFLAAARRGSHAVARREVFAGDRRAIRLASVAVALELLLQQLPAPTTGVA